MTTEVLPLSVRPDNRSFCQTNSVVQWLRTIPSELRMDRTSRLYDLGDRVIYGQLLDESEKTNLGDAFEFVSTLASRHVAGRAGTRFVEILVDEPRLVELGLLMTLTRMRHAIEIPRTQEFYPAVLFDRDVLSVINAVADRDQPAEALMWRLVRGHEPVLAREIEASSAQMQRGFSRGIRWPDGGTSALLHRAVRDVHEVWQRLGTRLLEATIEHRGTLPIASVDELDGAGELLRVERVGLVNSINRFRQKRRPEDLLRWALNWPTRASAIMGNLEGPIGCLRLYIAYLDAVWSNLLRRLDTRERDVDAVAKSWGELIEREIAYPIAASAQMVGKVVTLFEEASAYDQLRKKRLSRQRERCLPEALDVADSDWLELLEALCTGSEDLFVR